MTKMYGVAIDAGSGLLNAIKDARGQNAKSDDFYRFKRAILKSLGTEASTVLVDAALGPKLLHDYPKNCVPTMAYEADVYHISSEDRITILPENLSISDFHSLGVNNLKFFMYYAPKDDPELNSRKEKLIESIGIECEALGLEFLFEPLVYHPKLQSGTADYAASKPEMVRRVVEIFAHPRFRVSTLKVEIPVDLGFVKGFGKPLKGLTEVYDTFGSVAKAAKNVPLVFLSAGVTFEWFDASLLLARDSGISFNGFMCGRAIWADAIEVYGSHNEEALIDWLATTGRKRLKNLIATIGGDQ
ncbi:MAG: tagatose 1,6-diphosphate aldolase [Paracoccaceae bacterium]|nr:tagatose 1,6-diphosphate aldolase [Paracoccaceae bacterium]